jgi:formiminoglutamate deiminase
MYRFVGQMTPEDLLAIAAQAQVEMLESGFTRVGEFHYLHHDPAGQAYADPAQMSAAVVTAAQESGIGLTLLPVLYSHAGFGGQAPSAGQARFLHDLDGFARLLDAARGHATALPDAVVGVAPHSLRAVTLDQLAHVPALAQGAPIHIHIAEQTKEVDDCVAWSGRRPVELLLDRLAVDGQWCLVHATHMTTAETEALVPAAPWPGCARSPRPIWATACSQPGHSWRRGQDRAGQRSERADRCGRGSAPAGIWATPGTAEPRRSGRRAGRIDR